MDKLTRIVKKAILYGVHTQVTEGETIQSQAEAVSEKIEREIIEPREEMIVDDAVDIVRTESIDRVEAEQEIRTLVDRDLGY